MVEDRTLINYIFLYFDIQVLMCRNVKMKLRISRNGHCNKSYHHIDQWQVAIIVISIRPLKTTAQMTILVLSDQNLKDLHFNFKLQISSINTYLKSQMLI